ncbi:hypothetical protein K438DRAFT_1775553 [Mycena galopus ATCC 62051]|nr:hypothetical protein K438DRAFT_1775553 [Mycena galopus ATCC 62051]
MVPTIQSGPSVASLTTTTSPTTTSLFPISPSALVLADRKHYPDVVFWTRKAFKDSRNPQDIATMNSMPGKRGGSRAAKDINVMNLYLENSDGSIISGHEAAAIRKTQSTICRVTRLAWLNGLCRLAEFEFGLAGVSGVACGVA